MKQKKLTKEIRYKAPRFNEIFGNFNYGQSIDLLGNKGVGKTNLLTWFFMLTKKRCIFWDSTNKPQLSIIAHKIINVENLDELKEALQDQRLKKIKIYIPRKHLGNNELLSAYWNHFNAIISEYEDILFTEWMEKQGKIKDLDFTPRKNIVIINDELMTVTREFKDLPENFRTNIIIGGNEALSFINAYQRHQGIPKQLAVASEFKIIMRIDDYDVYALTGKVHDIQQSLTLPPFHFIVYCSSTGEWNEYKPIPLLLEKRFIKSEA